jgi:hypothetical protein
MITLARLRYLAVVKHVHCWDSQRRVVRFLRIALGAVRETYSCRSGETVEVVVAVVLVSHVDQRQSVGAS